MKPLPDGIALARAARTGCSTSSRWACSTATSSCGSSRCSRRSAATLLDDADNVDNLVDVDGRAGRMVRWLNSWIGGGAIDPSLPTTCSAASSARRADARQARARSPADPVPGADQRRTGQGRRRRRRLARWRRSGGHGMGHDESRVDRWLPVADFVTSCATRSRRTYAPSCVRSGDTPDWPARAEGGTRLTAEPAPAADGRVRRSGNWSPPRVDRPTCAARCARCRDQAGDCARPRRHVRRPVRAGLPARAAPRRPSMAGAPTSAARRPAVQR